VEKRAQASAGAGPAGNCTDK